TIFILKDAQCAGFGRKDCKVHSDAFAASAVFQNKMSVHHAAASRLRRARDNRPISLCGRCEDKEEKRTSKTHSHMRRTCRRLFAELRILSCVTPSHRIFAPVPENADCCAADPKSDSLLGLAPLRHWAGLTIQKLDRA